MLPHEVDYVKNIWDFIFGMTEREKRKCYVSFKKWLANLIKRYLIFPLILISIILSLLFGFKLTCVPKEWFSAGNLKVSLILMQIFFILMALLFTIKSKYLIIKKPLKAKELDDDEVEVLEKCGYNKENYQEWAHAIKYANEALEQYKFCWSLIWLSWLLLYAVLYFQTLTHIRIWNIITTLHTLSPKIIINLSLNDVGQLTPTPVYAFLLNFFNNLGTLFFILCYLVLTEITTENKETCKKIPDLIPWAAISIIITILDGFFSFANLYPPPFFGGIGLFPLLAGILAGVAMTLYIGRFDSEFINAPTFLMASLYAYAIIQTFFYTYTGNNDLKLLIIILAFIFKIILFLFMVWLFKSRRLLFYFIRVRKIYFEVEPDWKNFYYFFYEDCDELDKEDYRLSGKDD